MSRLAIRIDGLGKRYERVRPGQQRPDTLRDALSQAVGRTVRRIARPGRRSDRGVETFWALRDVSLELRQGEVLGLIGANGAGKSTLLKILSRITHPTSGRAEVMGRVGSLLEVGTGFNWELTGRENVYLNGAILGMRRAEIRRKFDEIVAFAEVEAFIDTPIKFYSTGMYMRLAFAVAAFLEPEILIVDEVLAVGDASFQRKCLGTMGAASRQGRTVLFVSHNMLAIEGLSHRVVWLAGGKVVRAGSPKEVVSAYLAEGRTEVMERSWPAPADGDVHLRHARVRPARDAGLVMRITEPVTIDIDVRTSGAGHISPVLNLYNEQDILVFTSSPPDEPDWRSRPTPAGLVRFACTVPADLLNDGLYRVAVILRRDYETVLTEQECLVFNVMDVTDRRAGWFGEWPGIVRPVLDWTTEALE